MRCRWPAICWCKAIEEWRSQPRWNLRLAQVLLNDTRWLEDRPEAMAAAARMGMDAAESGEALSEPRRS